jgi:hypothetical protein
MVTLGKTYTPDLAKHERHMAEAEHHRTLYDTIREYRQKRPQQST